MDLTESGETGIYMRLKISRSQGHVGSTPTSRTSIMKVSICRFCGERFNVGKNCGGIYCSNRCQQRDKSECLLLSWLAGEEPGWTGKAAQLKDFVRRYLHETRGTACFECGWDKRHPVDGSVLTEVDHIDGNAKHCLPENLRILCPNCHSMTPTFRRRNLVSQRLRS